MNLLILAIATASFFWASPAHAYVDPGTGTFVLQLFLALLAGSLFYARKIWSVVSSTMKRLTGYSAKPKKDPSANDL